VRSKEIIFLRDYFFYPGWVTRISFFFVKLTKNSCRLAKQFRKRGVLLRAGIALSYCWFEERRFMKALDNTVHVTSISYISQTRNIWFKWLGITVEMGNFVGLNFGPIILNFLFIVWSNSAFYHMSLFFIFSCIWCCFEQGRHIILFFFIFTSLIFFQSIHFQVDFNVLMRLTLLSWIFHFLPGRYIRRAFLWRGAKTTAKKTTTANLTNIMLLPPVSMFILTSDLCMRVRDYSFRCIFLGRWSDWNFVLLRWLKIVSCLGIIVTIHTWYSAKIIILFPTNLPFY